LAGVTEPGDIPRLVEKYKPKIILLDVMMPETDGWDILTQLRHCLKNQPVSIVICSIMPMEGLARSLGANGFLQKPVLPLDFLRKLDEQVEQFSSGFPTGNETTHDNLSIE
jgi:CheY-like chemotaxis protein